jgi:hypothetical protein
MERENEQIALQSNQMGNLCKEVNNERCNGRKNKLKPQKEKNQ